MNSTLARHIYFSLQRLRGEPVLKALEDLTRTESWTREDLLALRAKRQLAQLRFVVNHVPVYSELYSGLLPKIKILHSPREVEEFLEEDLPTIQKETVIDRYDEFLANEWENMHTHPNKTSGSTGTPLEYPCDQRAWAYRHAGFFRCARSFGVHIGEPYGYFFGLHWSTKNRINTWLRDRVLNRVRVSAYHISRETLTGHVSALRSARPTHFLGYPSAISEFCILAEENGVDLRPLHLKAIFLTAEQLLPVQRKVIEDVTGAPCVDTYGSVEGGFGVFECPEGSRHIAVETCWLEPRGRDRSAIVTDLFLRAFPLIRYEIGDEIIGREGVCACGREHPLVSEIGGRSGDPIVLPNGRRINANLPSYLFKDLGPLRILRQFRFVDQGDGQLTLLLSVTSRFGTEHEKLIRRETARAFGDDVQLSVQYVERMPLLPNAKHRCYLAMGKSE